MKSFGFTLIELLVTLAIGVILGTLAVPSVVAFLRNSELTSATNTLLAGINAARSEAMKKGQNAMMVPINNGSDWRSGWVIFVDTNRSQNYTENIDSIVSTQSALPSYFSITANGTAAANPPYILFDPSGYSKNKSGGFQNRLTISIQRNDLSGTELLNQTRRLIIYNTGRTRTCKPTSTTDADCSSGLTP